MSATLRMSCPNCSATMARSEGSRAEECPFCGTRSVVFEQGRSIDLRSYLSPIFDASEAPERARLALVRSRVLSSKQAARVTFLGEPELYFVPYRWLTATRIINGPRVAVDDFETFSPAVDVPRLGVGRLDLAGGSEEAPIPEPFDGAELRKIGFVLAPTMKGFGELERKGEGGGRSELIACRRRILYVPFWRIPYELAGRRYEVVFEGQHGKLTSARGPEDGWFRVPVALGGLALPSLLLGKFLAIAFDTAGTTPLGVTLTNTAPFILILLLFLVFLGTFSWSLLRYEAEHVFERGMLRSEQLGRPRAGRIESLVSGLARTVGGAGRRS